MNIPESAMYFYYTLFHVISFNLLELIFELLSGLARRQIICFFKDVFKK